MDWALSFIPWWFWLVVFLVLAAGVRVYAGSWKAAVALIGVGLAVIAQADRARSDADRRNADPGRLRDDDGFRRD